MPAASAGQSPAAGGAPAADAPLGLFDALLALVSSVAKASPEAADAPPTGQQPQPQQDFLGLLSGFLPAAATDMPADANGDEAPADPAALLAGLLDILGAAQPALAKGEPLDPATAQKLGAAIDALAAALGIALPAADGGSADATVLLDPLKAITAAANPTAPAAAQQATTAVAAGAEVAAADAASTRELPPLVAKLAEKLNEIAASLKPASPDLSEKLRALAGKLAGGEIDAQMLAKLGLPVDADAPHTEVEAALARLLAPVTQPKTQPAETPFTTATLALPTASLARSTADGKTPAPATEKSRLEPAPEAELRPRPDTRPIERAPEQANAATARAGFGAAMQAAGETAQPQVHTPAGTPALPGTLPVALAADARAIHAAYRSPVQQINIPQVAFEIVRQVQAGASRFQIRLDPPELGRIDVKLDVDAAGNVNARLTVERAETLDLMQRDQRALERALAQAGLDGSKTNLEFSLRQNPFAREEHQHGGNAHGGRNLFGGRPEADDALPDVNVAAYRAHTPPGGVNLFV